MTTDSQDHRDYGFIYGLLTGTVLGAGLAMWLAPRLAAEVRDRAVESANRAGRIAADRYHQASTRLVDTVGDLADRGQDVRDGLADAVAQGAHVVERLAKAARSDRR